MQVHMTNEDLGLIRLCLSLQADILADVMGRDDQTVVKIDTLLDALPTPLEEATLGDDSDDVEMTVVIPLPAKYHRVHDPREAAYEEGF